MELDINEIMKILPHRPPLLLVDRIVEIEPFKSATGIKCITMNEPQFNGHFPGHPIMPGVLPRDGDCIWQCSNCGHLVIGKKAPEMCPVCNHPQAYFQVKAENY